MGHWHELYLWWSGSGKLKEWVKTTTLRLLKNLLRTSTSCQITPLHSSLHSHSAPILWCEWLVLFIVRLSRSSLRNILWRANNNLNCVFLPAHATSHTAAVSSKSMFQCPSGDVAALGDLPPLRTFWEKYAWLFPARYMLQGTWYFILPK